MSLLQWEIDRKNAEFWSELCGSRAARRLKITDSSSDSIKKFDDWYFSFYPYLKEIYLSVENLSSKTVLEIGLGYGTVSQFLAENTYFFTGVDISAGPVDFLNHRLKRIGKPANAKRMSAHKLDFSDNFFDFVVSIGCFHHTGNISQCIEEVYRVLKPGGQLLFMCYNQHSLREFLFRPGKTLFSGYKTSRIFNERERAQYDSDLNGQAAPFTELFSKKKLAYFCKNFSDCKINVENVGGPLRKYLINNIGKILGTDRYVQCIK